MSRIIEAWEALLREAISTDYDNQQNAVFQIGLVLQRHNPYVQAENEMYEESLSRELQRLTLDESRQRDTVVYLAELVRRYPREADSFLYAMSNAQPKILIEPLLRLLQEMGDRFKPDAAYQALMALDGAIRNGGQEVAEALREYDLSALLENWQDNRDDLLADKAEGVARRVGEMLGE